MYLYVSVDSLIRSFDNARRYAEAHNRGNEASMFTKIVRDLDTIKNIPPEAFAGMVDGEGALARDNEATIAANAAQEPAIQQRSLDAERDPSVNNKDTSDDNAD